MRQSGDRNAIGDRVWRLPTADGLNVVLQAAELARLASCVFWPALRAARNKSRDPSTELETIDSWFAATRPPLDGG